MKYKIIDWTGKDLSDYYSTFDSAEDAWGALYEIFGHLPDEEFNEQMEEFYVEEVNEIGILK